MVAAVEDETHEGQPGDPTAAEIERLNPGKPTSTAMTAAATASESGRRKAPSTSATRSCWKPRRRVTAPVMTRQQHAAGEQRPDQCRAMT